MSQAKFKPCPFCGSSKLFIDEAMKEVRCIDCQSYANDSSWNKRHFEEKLKGALNVLLGAAAQVLDENFSRRTIISRTKEAQLMAQKILGIIK